MYDDQPRRLVTELLRIYHRRPSVFCRELPASGTGAAAVEPERDPVCGMWINPQSAAAKRTIHEKRSVFCSLQFTAEFDEHPARFVAVPSH